MILEYGLDLLSYDVESGSDITPCIKIDKALVVYRFLVTLRSDSRNSVMYIWQNLSFFT